MGEIQGKLPIWETSGELMAKHIRAIGELTFGTGTRCGRPVALTLPVHASFSSAGGAGYWGPCEAQVRGFC